MKRHSSRRESTPTAERVSSPAPVIIRSAGILLCILYISAIALLLLPESLCDKQRAAECARDIFSASFRVVALTAISAVSAEIIDIHYPDSR